MGAGDTFHMRVQSSAASSFVPGQYAEPLPGEELRIGHSGPQVVALQQKLNAMGAKPPLVVDGKLGPKTNAAMQLLLNAKPAANTPADQFSTPPATPPGPALQTPATDAVIPASQNSDLSNRVVENAFAENDSINPMKRGEDGKVKGWKELQTIFQETTGWKPTDAQCQDVQAGKGLQPGGKSWCGIWACHIFQKSGANVKWDGVKGGMVGDVTHTLAPRFTSPASYKAERQAFEQSIRPGDCITLNGANNHHAIVTKVNPDGTVETMDGNKPHVGPGHQKLSDVTSFYRPIG